MTTIAKEVGRGGFLIHRGSDERFYARWTENRQDGKGDVPINLRDWTATFTLRSNGQVVYSCECSCDFDGYAIAKIPGDAFVADEWRAKSIGSWDIIAYGPNGEREMLGWGDYKME